MPHLFKPWQQGPRRGSGSYWRRAGRPAPMDERTVRRDASRVRLMGVALLLAGVVLFALGWWAAGAIAVVFGIGLVILDSGLLLIGASIVFGGYAMLRAAGRWLSGSRGPRR